MNNSVLTIWKEPVKFWLGVIAAGLALGYLYYDGLARMWLRWEGQEEYSYGYMIPMITLFLIWQRKDLIQRIPFTGSWLGLMLVLGGIALLFAGQISTIYAIVQYGFLLALIGMVYTVSGWQGLRPMLVPLIFLAFMIPLPGFYFHNLSASLQLISSQIGVAVIRLFDISVYLEGNVIDLGTYKLQVVEACSGLRYLFPLMSLAFISAYFYSAAWWKKAVIFLSSIPITIFMNSFRIGVIGVLVEYWGIEQAEGFLHDFEGWIIFMACMGILILEMALLTKVGKERKPLQEVFGLVFPEPAPKDAQVQYRRLPAPFFAAIVLVGLAIAGTHFMGEREPNYPQRTSFDQFPRTIGAWTAQLRDIEPIYLDQLKLDDYFLADYSHPEQSPVNFYVAYYAAQNTGESAHSPRSCIPGGGWVIENLSQTTLDEVSFNGAALRVNRLVIRKGDYAQLVYYWFQQRGRNITNEYAVKWYLFLDALQQNRTDGALVRLTTLIRPGQELADADARLRAFAAQAVDKLEPYVPN